VVPISVWPGVLGECCEALKQGMVPAVMEHVMSELQLVVLLLLCEHVDNLFVDVPI